MSIFRVALSGDFKKADGSPTFPDFDLAPLMSAPHVEVRFLENANPLRGEQLEDFDALILLAHRFGAESVPKSGRLTAVARFGVGYDTVDVAACTANDIALCITPDGVRRPVAVSIVTFMLALTGKMMVKDKLARMGPPGFAARGEHMGTGLVGRTFGSLGVGNIGAETVRLLRPFDMRCIAHDPFADPAICRELGIELVSIEHLFARADVLSISCPLTPETHHIVNAERLAMMKPTSYLINTARGPIVDQKALTRALQERQIAGAGLDVFEVEPTDPGDPLLKLDNVIVAPHALCWTDQCFAGNGAADVRAVLDLQKGLVPGGVVNRAVLERSEFKSKLEAFRSAFAHKVSHASGVGKNE
jgi:phosphoglycerate dehydrogenase-like enzyme